MRSYFLVALFALLAMPAAAQFQIGDTQIPTLGRAGALKDENLERLKQSTTVFVVQPADASQLDLFRKSIADVWTITPFHVVLPDSARYFRGGGYTMFDFGGYSVQRQDSRGMQHVGSQMITYELTIADLPPRERGGRTVLARIALAPCFAERVDPAAPSGAPGRGIDAAQDRMDVNMLYRTLFCNWGPGQLRGYLKAMNDHLVAGQRRGIFDAITDEEGLRALRQDTLFLPDYLNVKLNFMKSIKGGSGIETGNMAKFEAETRKSYPFPVRFISTAELETRLVNTVSPMYHLIYIRSAPYKFVSVVEAQSGRIVYSRLRNMSYNFGVKDLEELANEME